MKCDYCGSLFEKVPKKGVCPNCGAAFSTTDAQQEIKEYPKPPIGKYVCCNGFLEILNDRIEICFIDGLSKKETKIIIPFYEVEAVKWLPAQRWVYGKIWVWDKKKMNSFPSLETEDVCGPKAFIFLKNSNQEMEIAYQFLAECAKINSIGNTKNV